MLHQDGIFFSMDQDWLNSFREKLDQHHAWPTLYVFKFIVPAGKENEVVALFPKHEVTLKASKNGNYISVTTQIMMHSGQSVIDVYVNASTIEGLIAL